MKTIALVLLLTAVRVFAADDTNLLAAGDWSQPVANRDGWAIRGRLLICDTPPHSTRSGRGTDPAVYLELQEFSEALRAVRVYCDLEGSRSPEGSGGLRCALRDSAERRIPNSPGTISGPGFAPYWVTLMSYSSVRLRVSFFGGRLEDGGMAVYLMPGWAWWDVHPSKTNDYYLSGTFTALAPTNSWGLRWGVLAVDSTDRDVWYGTLTLPPVKIPLKRP